MVWFGLGSGGHRAKSERAQKFDQADRVVVTARYGLLITVLFLSLLSFRQSVFAQAPGQAQITWEVANRFRLFAEQKDFDRQVTAWRSGANGAIKSILDTERTLEKSFDGEGWASTVGRLCYDRDTGALPTTCLRDNRREDYLKPDSHLIKLKVTLPAGFSNAQCTWTIGPAPDAKPFVKPCDEIISDQRVPDKEPTPVRVVAETPARQTTEGGATIEARDFLIIGLGDSTASGEGNPDQPIALSDTGFCFARVLAPLSPPFYLPGRANALNVADDCEDRPGDREAWDKAAAGWLFAACHSSLYSYQMRAALALAIENPDISVTFIPLGCTGATIQQGLLGPQEVRERPLIRGTPGPRYVGGQLEQLASYVGVNTKLRPIDLIFLTVGANDVGFSGLVADIIVQQNPERRLFADFGLITSPNDAQKLLESDLKNDFAALRNKLSTFVGGDLERVVFVSYGDPARYEGGKNCPASRQGFDAHPAFSIDGVELGKIINFVEDHLLPTLKDYAVCGDSAAGCSDPSKQRMTFVADHQAAFADHGFCAVGNNDPPFDKHCFRDGDSFAGPSTGLTNPLTCREYSATAFRPYAERMRWVRTANDSYFTAMTYPWTAHNLLANPSYIHDGRWGLTSVVYGGALHPTAEGHAAMADAALAAANTVLKLPLHSANSGFVQ
jgi:hypothetical protein